MPVEYHRTRGRKTIELPSGDRIDVPVIIKVSFIDPVRRYQETEHSFDNTETSNRRVHVDEVHPVDVDQDGIPIEDSPTQDESQDLFVERIDTWNSVDPVRRHQETQLTLDNTTGNDQLPPHFSNHERSHIYRYYQDPENPDDEGVWIDSELIDEFRIIDPVQRHQERRYTLDNPTNTEFRDGDLSGQASNDDPDITIGGDAEGTEDNPVRLDPFQNIVNFNSGETHFYFSVGQNYDTSSAGTDMHYAFATDSGLDSVFNPPPNGFPPPVTGTNQLMGAYLVTARAAAVSRSVFSSSSTSVTGNGPAVSLSPSSISFAPWEMTGTFVTAPGNSFQSIPTTNQPSKDYSIGIGHDSSVVGPPLIVNGQEKEGFIDTLSASLRRAGAPFSSGPYTWSSAFPPADVGPSTGTWWNYTGGIFDQTALTVLNDVVATVSPAPFEFNNGTWQAIGLSNLINTNHGIEIEIYCIRV